MRLCRRGYFSASKGNSLLSGMTTKLCGAALLMLALMTTGCGGSGAGNGASGSIPDAAFKGQVDGGGPQNPISGSTVTLYAMGGSGYGTATALTSATTDSDGNFSLDSFTCPSASTQSYVATIGGDAGGGINPAIGLIALAGPCGRISDSTFVTVNELTTVAAEWALAQFSDPTGQYFGTSATNLTGLNNAVSGAESNLVVSYLALGGNSSNTGIPASFLPWSPLSLSCTSASYPITNCDGLERIDTLANILASCVNTSGPDSASCSALFSVTANSATTLQAAHVIATNPAANVSEIFAVTPPENLAPFAPALGSAPGDWTLALNINPSGANFSWPANLAIDSAGNIWVTNYFVATYITELTPTGALATVYSNANIPDADFGDPYGIGIDTAGNVWVSNENSGSVTQLTSGGALIGNYNNTNTPGADFLGPTALAIDLAGHVLVLESLQSSITELTSSGSLYGYYGVDSSPEAVAIDAAGSAWVVGGEDFPLAPQNSFGSVTKLVSSGSRAGSYAFDNAAEGVALDTSGNAWVADDDNSVTKLSSNLGLIGSYTPSGANFNMPVGIAIDGGGNVWITNCAGACNWDRTGNGGVTELTSSGTLIGYYTPLGAAFNGPRGIEIDASGNIWITNYSQSTGYNGSVSEIIGAARPVRTPLVSCLTQSPPSAVCLP